VFRLSRCVAGRGPHLHPLALPPLLTKPPPPPLYHTPPQKNTASTNFVSFPSRLTANAEQQLSMYTYDSSTDAIYLVGGRNEQVTPYMAAGMFKKRTIYAGLATLLTVEGTVPIPVTVSSHFAVGFGVWGLGFVNAV